MRFDPKVNKDNFSTFWSCGNAWGNYRQSGSSASIEVEYGILALNSIQIPMESATQVFLNKKKLKIKREDHLINFQETVLINQGDVLKIE
jgi:hypothetical protein